MQAGHARTTSKKSQIRFRHKFSPTAPTMTRRSHGSDQEKLVAAVRLRFSGSDVAVVPRQPRRSEFKTETRILQEDIRRFIENESLRIAKQQSFLRSGATPESGESSNLQVLSIAFSSPQSTLEFLGRHQQINQAERQFLTYTIQAVSFVLGTNPAISKNLTCLRRRAKQMAGILANAIGQSSPPPESTRLLISPFLTV
jgi:hypothetical protein